LLNVSSSILVLLDILEFSCVSLGFGEFPVVLTAFMLFNCYIVFMNYLFITYFTQILYDDYIFAFGVLRTIKLSLMRNDDI